MHIQENSSRLTANKLKELDIPDRKAIIAEIEERSATAPEIKEKAHDIMSRERVTKASKFSKFEEKSLLDQDDAYGNYKPKFQTKNYKVTGGTREVIKLQRIASLDQRRALLAPIQPDLTKQKVSKKRIFKNANQVSENHFEHFSQEDYSEDGSPLPRPSHFFRKAEE